MESADEQQAIAS